jgi:TolA-binding protein
MANVGLKLALGCTLVLLHGATLRDAHAQREASEAVAAPPVGTAQLVRDINGFDVLDAAVPIGKIRVEQIQLLVELLAQTSDRDVDEKADLYRRLADLYSNQFRSKTTEAAERRIAANAAVEQAAFATLRDAAAALEAEANLAFDQAVATYERLVNNDTLRTYHAMDKALFSFGCLLLRKGRLQDARRNLDILMKNFPESPELPNTYMLIGDQLMANGNVKLAIKVYERTTQTPGATGYWYALYQLGAIAKVQLRNKDARRLFMKVITGAPRNGAANVLVRNAAQRFIQ